jgi:hypothetical protein
VRQRQRYTGTSRSGGTAAAETPLSDNVLDEVLLGIAAERMITSGHRLRISS